MIPLSGANCISNSNLLRELARLKLLPLHGPYLCTEHIVFYLWNHKIFISFSRWNIRNHSGHVGPRGWGHGLEPGRRGGRKTRSRGQSRPSGHRRWNHLQRRSSSGLLCANKNWKSSKFHWSCLSRKHYYDIFVFYFFQLFVSHVSGGQNVDDRFAESPVDEFWPRNFRRSDFRQIDQYFWRSDRSLCRRVLTNWSIFLTK